VGDAGLLNERHRILLPVTPPKFLVVVTSCQRLRSIAEHGTFRRLDRATRLVDDTTMFTRWVLLPSLALAVACRDGRARNGDSTAYFPPTIIAAGARRALPNYPCLGTAAGNATPILITGAGIGLRIPSTFNETPLRAERGVSFEDNREWQYPGLGAITYRVIPIADLRAHNAADSIRKEAVDVQACDTSVDGHQIHVASFRHPDQFINNKPVDEVRAWIPIGDGRMVRLTAFGEQGMRDTMLTLLRDMRVGLPPSHGDDFPHERRPVRAALSPDSVPVGDETAYRGHYSMLTDAGGLDTMFRITMYSTRAADVIHLERSRPEGDGAEVVAHLVLPPSIRIEDFAVSNVCKVAGVADHEVFGFYPLIAADSVAAHAKFAWRAIRKTPRFEPVTTNNLTCEPEDDGGDDSTGPVI
jgi:hypothetical protein